MRQTFNQYISIRTSIEVQHQKSSKFETEFQNVHIKAALIAPTDFVRLIFCFNKFSAVFQRPESSLTLPQNRINLLDCERICLSPDVHEYAIAIVYLGKNKSVFTLFGSSKAASGLRRLNGT